MSIQEFFSFENNQISFSRNQASKFAKEIAGDFNPLHDIDAKRFCVPGDLLFAYILSQHGLSQAMTFTFSGMVSGETKLSVNECDNGLVMLDEEGKDYLHVQCSGEKSLADDCIKQLINSYVAFSGQTFPHLLIPMLTAKNVMINPKRPMVIYENMSISLDHLNWSNIELELNQEKSTFETNGKRGKVNFAFNLLSDGKIIGQGDKNMVISGLKPFEASVTEALITEFNQRKNSYL